MGKIKSIDAKIWGLDGNWEVTEFDLTNDTFFNVNMDIFNPNTLTLVDTEISNSGVPNFFIGGSTNYNYFLRDILYAPALVRRIVFYSSTAVNFNQVVNHTYKDANGVQINFPRIPSLSVGMAQFQSGIGMLDFPSNELILGINEWFSNFFIRARSEIKMILIYKQIDKSNLLTNKVKLISNTDIIPEPVQQVSEDDLNRTPFDYIPIISERTYLNKSKNLISPFDLSAFNKAFEQKKVKKLI